MLPEAFLARMKVQLGNEYEPFLNSLERGMGMMRRSGVAADWDRRDTDSEICLTIRIPKTRQS